MFGEWCNMHAMVWLNSGHGAWYGSFWVNSGAVIWLKIPKDFAMLKISHRSLSQNFSTNRETTT
jgi:hypothetical protein